LRILAIAGLWTSRYSAILTVTFYDVYAGAPTFPVSKISSFPVIQSSDPGGIYTIAGGGQYIGVISNSTSSSTNVMQLGLVNKGGKFTTGAGNLCECVRLELEKFAGAARNHRFEIIDGVIKFEAAHHTRAIVLPPAVSVRSGLEPTSTQLFELHAGAKVKVVRQMQEHVKIRFAKDKIGWVPGTAVGRI
jgi:hypothetical protein